MTSVGLTFNKATSKFDPNSIQQKLKEITNCEFSIIYSDENSIACIFLTKCYFRGTKYERGDILLIEEFQRKNLLLNFPKESIQLYKVFPKKLSEIYKKISYRLDLSKKISDSLFFIKTLPLWKQCPQQFLKCKDLLGKGCYGNVFEVPYRNLSYAVKISKLKPEATVAYDKSISSWHETIILKDIIKPIIEKNISPNLPLLIDSFVCDTCKINVESKDICGPSVITVIEQAQGNLRTYLRDQKPSVKELYSCLFQIMAGLYAIQINGQIQNFDIKKENILYYDVEPGGCWNYRIRGKDYFVPNYGKLFVLNDFGISRVLSKSFGITRNGKVNTGLRYGIVVENKIVPLETSDGKSIIMDGKRVKVGGKKFKRNVKKIIGDIDIYEKPEIIPPFDFYNDMQDVIRMFIGGKRSTQSGFHKKMDLPKEFIDKLQKYGRVPPSTKKGVFTSEPYDYLAGYFIEDFFVFYLDQPNEEIIERYEL